MQAIWSRAKRIEPVDAAGRYLNARTGLTTFPDTLRFSKTSDMGRTSSSSGDDRQSGSKRRGERARRAAALHRTYLDGGAARPK